MRTGKPLKRDNVAPKRERARGRKEISSGSGLIQEEEKKHDRRAEKRPLEVKETKSAWTQKVLKAKFELKANCILWKSSMTSGEGEEFGWQRCAFLEKKTKKAKGRKALVSLKETIRQNGSLHRKRIRRKVT